MQYQLEICCYNLPSALVAQQAGAHRVELCADPADGGTTPSYGTIKTARAQLNILLYPIIRPRGGDFLYVEEDFEIMKKDIVFCKQAGCDGVVIGMLNEDGTVDKKRSARLVELAYPLGVTFHRAFDRAINPFEALEDIIAIGCERILTSGQRPTAREGANLLDELVRQADERIIIMPGSGIRSSNIAELVKITDAAEYHSSASTRQAGNMKYGNTAMMEELVQTMADRNEIEKMLEQLTASRT
ncbi:MAG TPA: copper homeostasis protein CutC [Puia sp.]|nr:copper homeostasis protein CutC [Puia sp.]